MGNYYTTPKPPVETPVTAQIGYHNNITTNSVDIHIGIISWCMLIILLMFLLVSAVIVVRYCAKCFNKRVERGVDAGMLRMQRVSKDMRTVLLAQKGATAIQTKMQQIRQDDRSISEFGRELSELFVDLTISQANGNSESFSVLKPLNEKTAIKKFADGLRNRRISTIIAARNFTSLKDAIQAAVDEEVSSPGTSGQVLNMNTNSHRNYNFRNRGNYYQGRSVRVILVVGRRTCSLSNPHVAITGTEVRPAPATQPAEAEAGTQVSHIITITKFYRTRSEE
ncbi:unnamed protein product [Plutella xylostella]|uniref:(diamondback moth) hypothetical protein n=1 Tax=Plutella xylostella TaxID=51655 RepID=A0A8S4GD46_PLUXY|nr:unnamed protein product [Plutella xylostella]